MKKNTEMSIILGDVGIGFAFDDFSSLPVIDDLFFIRGNHDNPKICKEHPNYLGDFGYIDRLDMFFISGAWSIDQHHRTEDIDWWADEELSLYQLEKAVILYETVKPKYVISHDAPLDVVKYLIPNHYKLGKTNRTQRALDMMWNKCDWRPNHWFFGHYHISRTDFIEKTKVSCIGIKQRYILND